MPRYWKGGRPHRPAVLVTWQHGDVYEGEWCAETERPDGEGVFVFADGASYQGQWKRGRRHGQGQERGREGDVYTGGWREDARHGFGLLEYANGSRYEGGWRNGAQHGCAPTCLPTAPL